MNRLILFLVAFCFSLTSFGQPILRNSLNTNALGTNLVWEPTDTLTVGHNQGSVQVTSNGITVASISAIPGANVLPRLDIFGYLRLSQQTNQLTIGGGQLLLDGVPIVGDASSPALNVYISNLFTIKGNVNQLTVSNSLTINTNGNLVLNLAKPSVLVLATNNLVTNATLSGLTLSDANVLAASGGGDTTWSNIVTLTQTGTNVSAMDYALVRGGGLFKLQLTNTAYIGAPSGVASTPFSKAWLIVQQPSTGTCFLTFTNGFYQFPEGVAPIIDTNNGAVTIYQFISDPITNGLLHGFMSLKSKLIP